MERSYWLKRENHAREMARAAHCSEARLIHYEMAGRYGAKATIAPDLPDSAAIAALCAAAVLGCDSE